MKYITGWWDSLLITGWWDSLLITGWWDSLPWTRRPELLHHVVTWLSRLGSSFTPLESTHFPLSSPHISPSQVYTFPPLKATHFPLSSRPISSSLDTFPPLKSTHFLLSSRPISSSLDTFPPLESTHFLLGSRHLSSSRISSWTLWSCWVDATLCRVDPFHPVVLLILFLPAKLTKLLKSNGYWCWVVFILILHCCLADPHIELTLQHDQIMLPGHENLCTMI